VRAHLRIARPTDKLSAIVSMYRDGLDLEILGQFQDHAGFDGVMLGSRGEDYHLEFTQHRGYPVGDPPSPENLLVFYVPDRVEWELRCRRMSDAGFVCVESYNPYWDQRGRTFEDLDGCRVVIQNSEWM
jgi:hypothetical protein